MFTQRSFLMERYTSIKVYEYEYTIQGLLLWSLNYFRVFLTTLKKVLISEELELGSRGVVVFREYHLRGLKPPPPLQKKTTV